MSADNIFFDYIGAEKQADTLEQLSQRMKSLSDTDMENILIDISNAWKGENAEAFLQKGDLMKEKIRNSATQLNNIAASIRRISSNMRKAEEEAASAAVES